MSQRWIAQRARGFSSSGIRKVFDLAAQIRDPVNLSIGQPDFDVPPEIQEAAIQAIRQGRNGYSLTQGIAELRAALESRIAAEYGHDDRGVLISSGTSGALVLAMLALVDPGDEVIVFDPYFVMYPALVELVGGKPVILDTYPHFRIDVDQVRRAITPRTKMIVFGSPANPTGAVAGEDEVRALAELAAEREIVLVSDEIYHAFCYDAPPVSPARFNPATLVVDGFSKTYGMTGWRLGFAHGPAAVIEEMVKLQQYTFVCAPHPLQWGAMTALDIDMESYRDAYRKKRDMLWEALRDDYEVERPGGAFYLFPKAPWGTGEEFVAKAIESKLLVIPGNIFSRRNTHFRISYAADDATIERGIEILRNLARTG